MSDQAYCAHSRVVHGTIPCDGTSVRDVWNCSDCACVFVPEPFVKLEAASLSSERDTLRSRVAGLEGALRLAIEGMQCEVDGDPTKVSGLLWRGRGPARRYVDGLIAATAARGKTAQ